MSGFAVIYRETVEHPLFTGDAARLGAWVHLILKACWKPTKFRISGKIVELSRGQLCASRAQLAEAWGWKPSAVERFLVRLETEQMIGRETGQGRTVITICNYDKYQDIESETGQPAGQESGQLPDSDRTTKEQRNQETKDIPSAKADGRGEPAPLANDMAASIFRTGLMILSGAGHEEPSARRIIGKWRKVYGTGSVLGVLASCQNQAAAPSDPIEWITAALVADQQRAAGQRVYHQERPGRASVRELGLKLAGETHDEQEAGDPEPRRLIAHGR